MIDILVTSATLLTVVLWLIFFTKEGQMSKKLFIIGIVFVVVMLGGFFAMNNYVFSSPKNCSICHYIAPYYKQWQTSTHNMVPCLKCHDYKLERAVAAQFLFLAGAYNPRPLTNVPDKNCLQSGCHDQRLVESKSVISKRGITFDHKPHFSEMKRGIKLHCRSCHSDIVQGDHMKVSLNVCYLCHFKGIAHDKAFTGCPSCHSAPKQTIAVAGKSFSHDDALKAGRQCSDCHLEITKGDGVTPKDKCYFCHIDRTEKYSDIALIHDKHVTQKQVDCLWCHEKIQHGKIKMASPIPAIK